MTATITERVAAGAAFLDEHDPDWWRADVDRAINLDTLDLGSGSACVLGQRCPLEYLEGKVLIFAFDAFAAKMAGTSDDDDEAIDEWASPLGFQVSRALPHLAAKGEFAALTAEWKRVITGRRMTSVTAASPCTLDDLKRDIAGLLLLLAAGAEPDVSECLPCAKAIEDRCADHAEEAAKALRLARTAEAVRKAQDRDEIQAALELAGGDSR